MYKKAIGALVVGLSIATTATSVQAQAFRYTAAAPQEEDFLSIQNTEPTLLYASPEDGQLFASTEFVSIVTSDGNIHLQRLISLVPPAGNQLVQTMQIDCGRALYRSNFSSLHSTNGEMISSVPTPSSWRAFDIQSPLGDAFARSCEVAANDYGFDWVWNRR